MIYSVHYEGSVEANTQYAYLIVIAESEEDAMKRAQTHLDSEGVDPYYGKFTAVYADLETTGDVCKIFLD